MRAGANGKKQRQSKRAWSSGNNNPTMISFETDEKTPEIITE